ncbi:MAG: DUF1583 domain-containing protein, partial [Isosphaeraceae bacterium]|nr:DUF1583 domain-containing protein [Isosphaeraceae bacterium]
MPRVVNPPSPIEWADLLAAQASLSDPKLQAHGEAMLKAILDQARNTQNWLFQNVINRIQAAHTVAAIGKISPAFHADPGLAFWLPSGFTSSWGHSQGGASSWWVEQQGVISHVTGAEEDFLYFDYPLAGTFTFSVEAYDGGWAEGHIAYGGLLFEAMGAPLASHVPSVGRHQNPSKSFPSLKREAFNRITLQVEPKKLRVLINGHLFHEEDDPSPTSPWLALFTKRERRTAYRNLSLQGDPVIPREVRLTAGDRMDGWVASYYGESQPPRRKAEAATPSPGISAAPAPMRPEDFDWSCTDGEIFGRRLDPAAQANPRLPTAATIAEAVQSRLFYQRPLRDGETLSYEFYYEPGETMVHPSMGLLAFLLEPDGVRLHWMTDGPENEWTGLKPDNVADEPENRRGPKPLPLKEKDWNAVTLMLAGDTIRLTLNDMLICERTLEPSNDRLFGLFHYKDRTAARVRNVVLTGPWPASLSPDLRANLAARRASESSAAERRARFALLGEKFFSLQAGDVLQQATALPPDRRYESLARWVLPNEDHPDFQLYVHVTPTNPAPPVAPLE